MMKNSKKIHIALSLLLLITACATTPKVPTTPREPSSEILYVSEAITSQGLFSAAIEGPAVDRKGNLYVVNFAKKGTIGIVRPGKDAELWLELPPGSHGNSIRFDRDGQMYVADVKQHIVYMINMSTKKIEIAFQDAKMNQPNDMAFTTDGYLFMSDPNWRERAKGGIWVASPSGLPRLMEKNNMAPNGIDVSPDETHVFVAEAISGVIYSYEIAGDKLVNKKLFYKFKPDTTDGIRFDSVGNLYVARIGVGSIDCLSPAGEIIRSIKLLGSKPTNIAFGGPDGRTMYVTNKDGGYVEAFRVEFPGREWVLQQK